MLRLTLVISVIAALSFGARDISASSLTTLTDVVHQTVTTNPDVLASLHAYQAATLEQRVAKGGYLPQLDVEAGAGREYIDDPRFSDFDFSRDQVVFSLSQMLFDGFATRYEVRRLGHAMRTRYYEVWEASEQSAAEATRAYYDVLRHRQLVNLSKDNYAAHRLVYEQIEQRVTAGFSRRVDLDQATGRLALSESNLLTDITNLHDVTIRYQRIVGELPAENLQEPKIEETPLPATVNDTVYQALDNSPLMNASIANVWSAEALAKRSESPMMPRFDIRARQEIWHDRDDINGRYEEGVIEVVGSYNLYNGGSDKARRLQHLKEANVAKDLRDKTCRDIRQQVTISYNNTQRLIEQLE